MKKQLYRVSFARSIQPRDIEETLVLSLIAVESLYGSTRVRMESRYHLDRDSRSCEIDTSNEVGLGLARIFIGYATLEYGEAAMFIEEETEEEETETTDGNRRCSCGATGATGAAS